MPFFRMAFLPELSRSWPKRGYAPHAPSVTEVINGSNGSLLYCTRLAYDSACSVQAVYASFLTTSKALLEVRKRKFQSSDKLTYTFLSP